MIIDTYLFIGGKKDGQRIALRPHQEVVHFPVYMQPASSLLIDGLTPVSTIKEEIYETMTLAGESERFTVYVLRGTKANEVMRALIDNYKGGDNGNR